MQPLVGLIMGSVSDWETLQTYRADLTYDIFREVVSR